MRIVQFLHGNALGGMEKFCIDLANVLSENHEVLFVGDSIFKPYLEDSVVYEVLDITKSRNNVIFLWKLLKIFQKFSPNIIHVHKQKSIQIMKRLETFLKVPYIATKHDTQGKKAFYGLEYAIIISEKTSKTIKAKHIYKIYNGIPYTKPQKITLSNTFNMVAVGGLRKVKGYDKLIEAVSNLTFEYHLTIIGEGDERKELETLIQKLDLSSKVSLVGFKSNVNDYLYSADLQVISSVSEGFSLAMIEGIFYSQILISTKVSGCTEILSDRLLYDTEDLAIKIIEVYENQEIYIDDFNKIKQKYKEKLTIKVCAKEHINIYKKVITNNTLEMQK